MPDDRRCLVVNWAGWVQGRHDHGRITASKGDLAAIVSKCHSYRAESDDGGCLVIITMPIPEGMTAERAGEHCDGESLIKSVNHWVRGWGRGDLTCRRQKIRVACPRCEIVQKCANMTIDTPGEPQVVQDFAGTKSRVDSLSLSLQTASSSRPMS